MSNEPPAPARGRPRTLTRERIAEAGMQIGLPVLTFTGVASSLVFGPLSTAATAPEPAVRDRPSPEASTGSNARSATARRRTSRSGANLACKRFNSCEPSREILSILARPSSGSGWEATSPRL